MSLLAMAAMFCASLRQAAFVAVCIDDGREKAKRCSLVSLNEGPSGDVRSAMEWPGCPAAP
jgi:hypothetical protein